MPAASDRRRLLVGQLAGNSRYHKDPDHPRLVELRRDLAVVQIEEFAEKVLTAAPPLTGEQRARLRALFVDEATS